jgi:hypothetical protein
VQLQTHLQTRGKLLGKIRLQMSSLDLLSEIPVVNRFGENRPTENEIPRYRQSPNQQPQLYNPRKEQHFPAARPNGERFRQRDWLAKAISQQTFSGP